MRALAVLTVRNEGAFLLEWLAHHRAVGFTDFLILSNDCDDGTDAMLDRLAALGLCVHLRNPGPHEGGVQWAALKRADAHPLVAAADWILALDVDEFVNIHTGDGTLSALLAALPGADAITLTWRVFGNNGVVRFADRPVTDQFPRAAARLMLWPWRAFMFKTLIRNDGTYRKLGVHRPRNPDPARIDACRWQDGHGRDLPPDFRKGRLFSPFGRDNYGLAQLNHYPLGSMESYLLKADRGRAVHGGEALGMDYWVDRNWALEDDASIGRYRDARDTGLADLKSDAALSRLHDAAVAWRRTRFESLIAEDGFRALFGRLLLTPPSRPLAPEVAQYLYAHAQKALERRD
jgi:hypothetical protein